MKYYFAYDNQGIVAFYSKYKNETDKFNQIELPITPEEEEKLKQNYRLWIKEGKLVLEKSPLIISEEKDKKIEEAKEKIKTAKTFEALKDLLTQIL